MPRRQPLRRSVVTGGCEHWNWVYTATVGTPVTRRPPCRPGRAVFPHPVPRLHSRPRKAEPLPVLALFAMARREVGSCYSGPTCPGCVSFPGSVLPSRPSPCSGLSPPLSTLRDKTPQGHPVGFPPFLAQRLYRARAGASGASQVLRHLSSCMPRPEDSGGLAYPCQSGWARVAFGSVKTLGVRY